MGLVKTEIELINASDISFAEAGIIKEDEIRHTKTIAIVDSGAIMLAINENIKDALGLKVRSKRSSELADGSIVSLDLVGPIEVRFGDRFSTTNALVFPGNQELLLGAIPMEEMDVLIDPARERLIPNPEHPNGPQMTLKKTI